MPITQAAAFAKLKTAINNEDLVELTALLQDLEIKHYLNAFDDEKLTPLMYAAKQGKNRSYQALLRIATINVNVANDDGVQAIHMAAAHLNNCSLTLTIATGASVHAETRDGSTAAHYLFPECTYEFDDIDIIPKIRVLNYYGAQFDKPNRADIAPLELSLKYDVDGFFYIVEYGRVNLFRRYNALLKFLTDSPEPINREQTIVRKAVESYLVANLLHRQNNSRAYAVFDNTESCLFTLEIAAILGHVDIFEYFRSINTELLLQSSVGQLPFLHLAATYGQPDVIAFYCHYFDRSVLNTYDRLGRAPIHYAAFWGNENIIALLAQAGADLTIPLNNPRRRSSFQIATSRGHGSNILRFFRPPNVAPSLTSAAAAAAMPGLLPLPGQPPTPKQGMIHNRNEHQLHHEQRNYRYRK